MIKNGVYFIVIALLVAELFRTEQTEQKVVLYCKQKAK